MSELQIVRFVALDRPLSDDALKFMEAQSSRARITRWSFSAEYNYSEFRGKTEAMLRRGYDVYLEYASYGVSRVMFRLAGGLPASRAMLKTFLKLESVAWNADKSGPGGILELFPRQESREAFWCDADAADEFLNDIAPTRDQLAAGDLRPLYLAWLASDDDDAAEPPIPAGLQNLPESQQALATFLGLSDFLIEAAAQASPKAPATQDGQILLEKWLRQQSQADLQRLAVRLLSETAHEARLATLALIRASESHPDWPAAPSSRTCHQLRQTAQELEEKARSLRKEKKAEERQKYLKTLAANPAKYFTEVNERIEQKTRENYRAAAKLLSDLREALGPEIGPTQTEAVAEQLRSRFPSRKGLIQELRKNQVLPDRRRKKS